MIIENPIKKGLGVIKIWKRQMASPCPSIRRDQWFLLEYLTFKMNSFLKKTLKKRAYLGHSDFFIKEIEFFNP